MSDVVKLNVGGRPFATSRLTLTRYPDSVLAKMFDPELGIPAARMDDSGAFFLDNCPKAFEVILKFLRTGRYYQGVDCDLEVLVDEAEYFGLNDLVMAICRSARDSVWFNISGKRMSIDSKLFDMHFGRLRKRDKLKPIPRDNCGAYIFDRDPQMFSVVRDYIFTQNYPRWIDHKLVREEALFYGVEALFSACLEHFTKRFVLLYRSTDQDFRLVGAGIVNPGQSLCLSINYEDTKVTGIPRGWIQTLSEVRPEDQLPDEDPVWHKWKKLTTTTAFRLLSYGTIADREVLWTPQTTGPVIRSYEKNSEFWTKHDTFLGVQNVNDISSMDGYCCR